MRQSAPPAAEVERERSLFFFCQLNQGMIRGWEFRPALWEERHGIFSHRSESGPRFNRLIREIERWCLPQHGVPITALGDLGTGWKIAPYCPINTTSRNNLVFSGGLSSNHGAAEYCNVGLIKYTPLICPSSFGISCSLFTRVKSRQANG